VDQNTFFVLKHATYFCENSIGMEQEKKNKGVYWLLFLAATAALAFAIINHWEWLTLILPFQTTAFVKAMDIM
jgi:hypothetical protein